MLRHASLFSIVECVAVGKCTLGRRLPADGPNFSQHRQGNGSPGGGNSVSPKEGQSQDGMPTLNLSPCCLALEEAPSGQGVQVRLGTLRREGTDGLPGLRSLSGSAVEDPYSLGSAVQWGGP